LPWDTRSARTPARRALSREAIIDAALKVLDEEGVGALSMRRVAQELGTGAASLYAHVANKDDLAALVFDRIAEEVPVPVVAPERWREQLKRLLWDTLTVLQRHPGSASLAMGRVPLGPNSLGRTEAMLALLKAGGVSDQLAGYAVDLLYLYVTATALEESIYLERGQTEESMRAYFEQVAAYLRALPTDRFPYTVSLVASLMAGGGDWRFDLGLDVLIAGLLSPEVAARAEEATSWPVATTPAGVSGAGHAPETPKGRSAAAERP
jgi:AcrR family transcriptional regulator